MDRQPWHWTEVAIGSTGVLFIVLGAVLRTWF